MERMPGVREYGTMCAVRNPKNSLVSYTLTLDRIRSLAEEVVKREREVEAARGARFRELKALLGLRAAVHAYEELGITVGAMKGVMSCDGSS